MHLPVVGGVDERVYRQVVDIVFVYHGHNSAFSYESSFLKLSKAFVVWCCAFSEDSQRRPASVSLYISLSLAYLVHHSFPCKFVDSSGNKDRLNHTGQEAHDRHVAYELSWNEWNISSKRSLERKGIHRCRVVQNISRASPALRDFKIAFVILA